MVNANAVESLIIGSHGDLVVSEIAPTGVSRFIGDVWVEYRVPCTLADSAAGLWAAVRALAAYTGRTVSGECRLADGFLYYETCTHFGE